MAHDFDTVVDRRQTESNKWRKYPADVLPLWVADMDFPSPEPVVRALRARAEHPFYGYGNEAAGVLRGDRRPAAEALRLARVGRGHPAPARRHPRLQPGVPLRGRAGRRAPAPDADVPADPARARQLRAHARGGAPRPRGGRALRDRLRRLPLGHPRADAPVPPVQSAQPGRPRVGADGSVAHRRDLPRAESGDRVRRDPLRPRLRRTPARADRLARPRDRAPHDHDDGAEQDLQPARAQVLDRHHPRRRRSGRSSSRPSSTSSGR